MSKIGALQGTYLDCFSTVCTFKPFKGTAMAEFPSPCYEEMVVVMRRVFESCLERGILIAMTPNIEVSPIVNPGDASHLVPTNLKEALYLAKLELLRPLARPCFARRMKPYALD